MSAEALSPREWMALRGFFRRVFSADVLSFLAGELDELQSTLPSHCVDALPISLVRRHGLAPIAFHLGVEECKVDFAKSCLAWERRSEILRGLSHTLAISQWAPIKGMHYAPKLYRDPGLRPMGDLDLLTPPHRFSALRDELVGLGFVARDKKHRMYSPWHHALTLDRGHVSLDLHRGMLQQGRSAMDLDALWSRAQENDGCWELAWEDHLVLHWAHLLRHELYAPGISYVDLALLQRGHCRFTQESALHHIGMSHVLEEGTALLNYLAGEGDTAPALVHAVLVQKLPSTSERWLAKFRYSEGLKPKLALAGIALGELLPWKRLAWKGLT